MKNEKEPLHIGLLTLYDAKDKHSWSGILFYMWQALERHCGEVKLLGPIPGWMRLLLKLLNLLSKITYSIFKKRFKFTHSLIMARLYARYFNKRLSQEKCDVIFAPIASAEIALLKTNIPIIYFSDATVAALIDYYPEFSHMFSFSKKEANHIESLALNKARLCISSSSWAADSVHKDYGIDSAKICTFCLGANIDNVPSSSEFECCLQEKINSKVTRLLFLGINWKRKGGDIVVDATLKLREAKENVELTICGCAPPANVTKKNYINVIPFLDKKKNDDRVTLKRLLSEAHFLFIPTRAESFGIVFCEAAAFGIPVISTNTGGVPSIVHHGINGLLLPLDAKGTDYAKVILEVCKDKTRYYNLAKSSRKEYEKRLNWDNWGNLMYNEILTILGK